MKFRKSLFFISIVSLFLAAFLFIISPNENLAEAATTDPTSSLNSTSPPGSTSSTTPVASTNTTNNTTPTPTKPTLFSELQVTGLGASDAKVTDMNGQPISPSDNLFTWLNFHVDYKWSIADGVQIHAGDTVNFELPSGLVSSGNLSFPIYDSNGAEVGTASIQNGASSGTITFNNALENTDIDRTGTLSLVSKGTNTGDGNQGTNWMFNKGGWVSGYDETSGVPDELTWNIAFNPNEHNLTNVVITDTLGPNEEYIPGSLNAISGSYSNGGFVSNGQQLNPTVTTDGNKVIISFPGTITTAVDIYYRVKVTNTDGTTTWTNHATMGSSEGNYEIDASTSWGGSGTGNGGQGVGTMTLTKTDAETGAPLAGAEYELKASDGTVIMSNVTTDQNGKIAIKNLPYGSYTLTEVRAPDGYTLNPTPIEFTLPDNGVINLTTDQKDTAETGAVVLKKLDPDTKDTIAGTTFNLLDSEGNVVKEGLVTDGNGEIAVDNLPAGNYQFVETQPAAGYELNTTPINFTVVAGQTTPVDLEKFDVAVTVTPDTGSVTLDKVDSVTGQFLPGAVFDLLDSDDNIIESGLITDENGQIKIPNLPVGSYYFIEMHAPGGYTDNLTPIEFTITKGQDASVTAKDNKGTDTEEPEEPEGPEPPVINPGNPEPPVEPGTPEPPTTNPGTPEPPVEPGTPEPPTTNPGTPEPPVEPGTPEPPTTNPGTPEPPVEPGTPEPPTTNPGNPEPPVEPGTPEPPTTNPGNPEPPVEPSEPSEPSEPGVTEPSEPSNPEPPVNPVEPSEPSEPSEPGVTVPTEPTEPTEPSEPEIPGVVIPPVYPQEPNNDEGNNSVGSGTPETGIPEASQVPNTSNSEKGKFPQTGNETGLFAMIIGLFILLVLLFKYLIKRLNY